jgi:tetratricopeptide (TPR) repeat protein
MRRPGVVLAAAALCLAGSILVVRQSSRREEASRPSEELFYFPSGRLLRGAALGNEALVADLAWLRAIQYYGEHRKTDRAYPMMGHIFDIITTLDARFVNAYAFGALVMGQDEGQMDAGIALLQKGIANNPESWFLPFEAGFLYYLVAKDAKLASLYFSRAARLPGCPDHVCRFAAHTSGRAGYSENAIRLWQEIAHTTPNEEIRRMAERKIEQLRQKGDRRDGA